MAVRVDSAARTGHSSIHGESYHKRENQRYLDYEDSALINSDQPHSVCMQKILPNQAYKSPRLPNDLL